MWQHGVMGRHLAGLEVVSHLELVDVFRQGLGVDLLREKLRGRLFAGQVAPGMPSGQDGQGAVLRICIIQRNPNRPGLPILRDRIS